jgi:hypothetical protein
VWDIHRVTGHLDFIDNCVGPILVESFVWVFNCNYTLHLRNEKKKIKDKFGRKKSRRYLSKRCFLIDKFPIFLLLGLPLRIFFILGVAPVATTRLVLGAVGIVQQSRIDGDAAGIGVVDKAGGGVDTLALKAVVAERPVQMDHVEDLMGSRCEQKK